MKKINTKQDLRDLTQELGHAVGVPYVLITSKGLTIPDKDERRLATVLPSGDVNLEHMAFYQLPHEHQLLVRNMLHGVVVSESMLELNMCVKFLPDKGAHSKFSPNVKLSDVQSLGLELKANLHAVSIFSVDGTDFVVACNEADVASYLVNHLGYDKDCEVTITPVSGEEHFITCDYIGYDEESDENILHLVRENLGTPIEDWDRVKISKTDYIKLTRQGAIVIQRSFSDELLNTYEGSHETLRTVPFLLASTEY